MAEKPPDPQRDGLQLIQASQAARKAAPREVTGIIRSPPGGRDPRAAKASNIAVATVHPAAEPISPARNIRIQRRREGGIISWPPFRKEGTLGSSGVS